MEHHPSSYPCPSRACPSRACPWPPGGCPRLCAMGSETQARLLLNRPCGAAPRPACPLLSPSSCPLSPCQSTLPPFIYITSHLLPVRPPTCPPSHPSYHLFTHPSIHTATCLSTQSSASSSEHVHPSVHPELHIPFLSVLLCKLCALDLVPHPTPTFTAHMLGLHVQATLFCFPQSTHLLLHLSARPPR